MNKFINWLVFSSANKTKIAASVKGFAITFLPLLILVLRYFGLDNPELGSLPEQLESFVVVVFGAIGGAITAFGLARKIIISFRKPIGTGFFE